MNTIDRRSLIAAFGASLLGAAAFPAFGATEKPPAEGGLGGTGIAGTLMGFGSLLVNGLEVGVDGTTAWSSTLGTFDPAALAIGQTLTIEAATIDSGLVAAASMSPTRSSAASRSVRGTAGGCASRASMWSPSPTA